MHKRAFQGLKRTFMHVSGLETCLNVRFTLKRTFLHVSGFHHQILIIELIYKVFGLSSKYYGGRPETCINVRFRA